MVKPTPSLAARARGLVLGHAAGNVLGLPAEEYGTATAIAERWPGGLCEVERRDTAASPWDDDVAQAAILAEVLLEPPVDLRRLAERWVEWSRRDGRGIGPSTRAALAHLAEHGAPLQEGNGRAGNGALTRALPLAIATLASPRNLVAASYHVAALTHPDPRSAWGAVALNVAAARLLRGERDFIPEVIAVLQANDAPMVLLDAARRVPFERREDLPVGGDSAAAAVHCLEIGLWFAHHEPDFERGVLWIANAGGDTDSHAAVAGGLMGARDGDAVIPPRWLAAVARADYLATLAERLLPATAAAPV